MKKNKMIKLYKRIIGLFIIVVMNINSYAAIGANDGSAFVTKAEFDALVNTFNEQMDTYENSLSSKIDGAIANYLSGLSNERTVPIILPGYTWMKSYGEDANIVELGIDTTDARDSKDGNDMYKQGKLYTYYPKYYFSGVLTVCTAFNSSARYEQEVYVGHIIDGQAYRAEASDSLTAGAVTGRNANTAVTEDKLISINPNIYYTSGGKDYVNKVYKALKVTDSEAILSTNPTGGEYGYGGWVRALNSAPDSSYDLYYNNETGVVDTRSFPGYQYQAIIMGTWYTANPQPSGTTSVGVIIPNRNNIYGCLTTSWKTTTTNIMSYNRAINVTEQKNEIVPRFKKLADSVADVNTNKLMAVQNKKDHYNNKKYYINKRTNTSTACNKIWYPIGNTSLASSNGNLPLRGTTAYSVYAYEANSVRKKATELYDYFIKDNFDIDSALTDRTIVYKNTEQSPVRLTFYIVPTSSFILTLSKDQKYEETEDNLYTFTYGGGTGSSSGSTKKLTIVHTAYTDNNPLELKVNVEKGNYVWLGGQSINNGYITFKYQENASLFIADD